MSVRYIVGKPGGGKTLYSMKLIVEDLVHTSCQIVTNIPVVWPELNAYIQERYPKADVDLHDRLTLLEDAEVFQFYRYRSGGLVLDPSPDKQDGKKLPKAEFIAAMKAQFMRVAESPDYRRPVHYYIDEVHNYFNAREWQEIGRSLLYYISQHRHLHDNIFLITQALANVEKQLKSVAQDYHVLRNMYKESIGMFRQSGCFRRRGYYSEPNGTALHFEESKFKLDAAGLCKTYKTCGALSIGYENPEQDRQPRKLPYWTMWAGAAAIILVFAAVLVKAPAFASETLVSVATPANYSGVVSAVTGSDQAPVSSFAPAVANQEAAAGPKRWMTGYMRSGERVTVYLEDETGAWVGRTDRAGDRVEAVYRTHAIVGGLRYDLKRSRVKDLASDPEALARWRSPASDRLDAF